MSCTLGEIARNTLLRGGTGSILGVFGAGCYFVMENGEVLLLHDACYGTLPFGVGVLQAGQVLRQAGLEKGMTLLCSIEEIRCPEANWRLPFAQVPPTDMANVPHSHCIGMQAPEHFLRQLGQREACHLLADAAACLLRETDRGSVKALLSCVDALMEGCLSQKRPRDWNLYCSVAAAGLARLLPACLNNDIYGVEQGLLHLFGLGPGLTPSMDDWLTGFAYMLLLLKQSGTQLDYIETLCRLIVLYAPLYTSAISAAYLTAAACGQRFSLLDEAVLELICGRECKLLRVGSSSGADMLTGMAFACELYERFCTRHVTLCYTSGVNTFKQ